MRFAFALLLLALLATPVRAAAPAEPGDGDARVVRVTGRVLELLDDRVVIQRGKDRLEIGLDDRTKILGALKVGARVTVDCRVRRGAVADKGGSPQVRAPKLSK